MTALYGDVRMRRWHDGGIVVSPLRTIFFTLGGGIPHGRKFMALSMAALIGRKGELIDPAKLSKNR